MTRQSNPQVFTERCSSCIFRPGDPMRLGSARVREVIERNRAAGAALICHQTLPYGSHPEVGRTVCRGFWDAYAASTGSIQVMRRLFGDDVFVEVEPPGCAP